MKSGLGDIVGNDDLIVLDGSTFFYSRANGDVDEEGSRAQGYFYGDVRHLSRFDLRIDGKEVAPLSSRRVDYYSPRAVGTLEGAEDEPRLAVRRDRFVSQAPALSHGARPRDARGAGRAAGEGLGQLARRRAREDHGGAPARNPGRDRPHPAHAVLRAHDTTPLFLIVLDEYERWSRDRDFVWSVEAKARAALARLEGPADLDGDGYVEYLKRSDSPMALDNQGWRDSDDSILFSDGRRAGAADRAGRAPGARVRRPAAHGPSPPPRPRGRGDGAPAGGGDRRVAGALPPRLLEQLAQALCPRAGRRGAAGRLAHLRSRPSALERDRRGAPCGRHGAALARGRPLQRVGDPLHVGARRGVQPARVPQGHGLAARHRDLRRGDAPLRLSRGRREGRPGAARRGRSLHEPAAGGLRRLRPRRDGHADRVSGALEPQSWAAGASLLVVRTRLGLDVVDGRIRESPCLSPGAGRLSVGSARETVGASSFRK